MYSLIKDKRNNFHVALREKCKRKKHSYSFEDSDGSLITGSLECSNDDLESLCLVQKNLASHVPQIKVNVMKELYTTPLKKKRKNITIVNDLKLKEAIIDMTKIKQCDGGYNLAKNKSLDELPQFASSTPNSSGTLAHKLDETYVHQEKNSSLNQLSVPETAINYEKVGETGPLVTNKSKLACSSISLLSNENNNTSIDEILANVNLENLNGVIEKLDFTGENHFDRIFQNSLLLELSEEEINLLRSVESGVPIEVNSEESEKPDNVLTSAKNNEKTNMDEDFDEKTIDSDSSYKPTSNEGSDESTDMENYPEKHSVLKLTEATTSGKQNETIIIEKNVISKGFDVSLPVQIIESNSGKDESPVKNVSNPTSDDVSQAKDFEDGPILIKPSNSGCKQHACLYCRSLQTRLPRHLELKHATEKDVQTFLAHPVGSVIRKGLIAKIRNAGDFQHNRSLTGKALKNRIVVRRPRVSNPKDARDFSFCPGCQASISQKTLSAHVKFCTGVDGKRRRIIKKISKIYDDDFHPETSKKLRNLIVCMHVDEVSKTIKFDSLLIRFGNTLCETYKLDQQKELIRNRLRLLSKLLVISKKIEKNKFEKTNLGKSQIFTPKIKDMTTLFNPQHVTIVMEAVKIMAGSNNDNYDMKAPSVASLTGTLLKQLGSFLKVENVMNNLKNQNGVIDDFLLVVDRKWKDIVNKNVLEAQSKKKRQKKIILPTTEDINKLMDYLLKQQDLAMKSLKKSFSLESYSILAETTLIIAQMFNRRRAGEMERVFWDDFRSFSSLKQVEFQDVMKNMSNEAKVFCDKYVRFTIRGKRGREVAVLLDETMFKAICKLEKYRLQAGIQPNNPYIFGIPGKVDNHQYLRACKLMRQYSKQCGAKSPDSLRGTTLRKHIATYLVNHNAANIDRSKLASHLGHSMGIHENYYHLVNVAEEICSLPRVLESACGAKDGVADSDDDSEDNSDSGRDNDNFDGSDNECPQQNVTSTSSINNDEFVHPCTSKSLDRSFLVNEELEESIKASTRRQRWENRHIEAMFKHFSEEIKAKSYPSKKKMEHIRGIEPLLKRREIAAMRVWFSNYYKKLNRQKTS